MKKFIPNYISKDKIFEVMADISLLENKPFNEDTYYEYCHNNEITVYNTKTERISEKSIYYSENKGFYFKGNSSYWTKTPHSRYYINDLEAIE